MSRFAKLSMEVIPARHHSPSMELVRRCHPAGTEEYGHLDALTSSASDLLLRKESPQKTIEISIACLVRITSSGQALLANLQSYQQTCKWSATWMDHKDLHNPMVMDLPDSIKGWVSQDCPFSLSAGQAPTIQITQRTEAGTRHAPGRSWGFPNPLPSQ